MNVAELHRLTKWVNAEIVEEQLPQKYQQLYAVLHKNSQPNQAQQPFETQQNDLIEALNSIHYSSLSKDQLDFLDSLGILPLIGSQGADGIENILFRNSIDIATATAKVQQLQAQLNEGIRKAKLLSDGLVGCIEEEETPETDEVLIRVTFQEDASMSNIVDFKSWGKKWHEIGRGVSIAHDLAPEDIKIIGASTGSIVIELAAVAAIAGSLSTIILCALQVAEKVLDLKKKAAEVRILNLQEKKLAAEIENAAETEKESGIKAIVDQQIKELGLDKAGDKVTALEKAINNLVSFVEQGGDIDFVVPDEQHDEEGEVIPDSFQQIRSQTEEIRVLENHLRLLEDNTDEASQVN